MTEVPRLLNEIVDWLAERSITFASPLEPWAHRSRLLAARRALDRPIPPEVAEWWWGIGIPTADIDLFPPFYRPLSITAALDVRESWFEVARSAHASEPAELDAYCEAAGREESGTDSFTFLPCWLPIATGGGRVLFADLRHGPEHGWIREFSAHGALHRDYPESTLPDLLEDTLESLRNSAAVIEDGELYWGEPGLRASRRR